MMSNNGQMCLQPSRLVIAERRKDEIVGAFVRAFAKIVVGPPSDPETKVGPLISRKQHEHVMGLLQSAITEGGRFATGGGRPEGLNTGGDQRQSMTSETPAKVIGLIDPETASAAAEHAFTVLPVINVFRAMANAETLYPPYIDYLSRLFQTLELDPVLERMIVLRVSKPSDCFHAWRQNVVVARSDGVTEAQIAVLDNGDLRAACFTAEQQIAFAFTDEVIERVEVTEQTYSEARKHFSDHAANALVEVDHLLDERDQRAVVYVC